MRNIIVKRRIVELQCSKLVLICVCAYDFLIKVTFGGKPINRGIGAKNYSHRKVKVGEFFL